MANNSLEDVLYQYACSPDEGSICDWIVRVYRVGWLFVAIGTLGNGLNLIVLSQRRLRTMPTSVYWRFLACADIATVWMLTIAVTTLAEKHYLIQRSGPIMCRISQWAVHTAAGCSVWFLVLLTVERFLCVIRNPFSQRLRLTMRRALIAAFVTFGVICLSNSHFFFGYTWVPGNDTCVYSSEEYKTFKQTAHSITLLIMYSIIPMFVIAAGNITIACKLRGHQKQIAPTISQAAAATKMLLFVSCLFMCATIPYGVFWATVKSLKPEHLRIYKRQIQLSGAVMFLLLISNFTFNFFLYCASGSLFREELKNLIRRLRVKCSSKEKPSQEEETFETIM